MARAMKVTIIHMKKMPAPNRALIQAWHVRWDSPHGKDIVDDNYCTAEKKPGKYNLSMTQYKNVIPSKETPESNDKTPKSR